MPYPYLEAHNIALYVNDASGMGSGDYTHVICPFRNINRAHNAVEIHHSLFEGDRMSFYQILKDRGDALDRMRPIRFYDHDPTDGGIKLFDGMITSTEYVYTGGDYMALKTNAVGWWRELARMNLHHPITYPGTWTVNEIYLDLVRLANDMGVMKEAVYTYDTTKIPEYPNYGAPYYITPTGTEFVVNNIYDGMKMLTRFLDSTVPLVSPAPHRYEFILRVESLPRATDALVATDPIDQADTIDHIYILPFPINQDKATVASFKKFQLAAGYEVQRDYQRLANDCLAIGSGYDTKQIRTIAGQEATTQTLIRTEITAHRQAIQFTNDTLSDHYLKITAENNTPNTEHIWCEVAKITRPGGAITEIYERFPMAIPANTIQKHFISVRVPPDSVDLDNSIKVHDFFNAVRPNYVTVEEITTGTEAGGSETWHTTIAGKSINTYGVAPHTIHDLWLNSQARVDLAAGKHCGLFHAPLHNVYAPIISRYATYDNLIGNTAEFFSPYEDTATTFLITDAVYGLRGNIVTQHLLGTRYEMEWGYEDS